MMVGQRNRLLRYNWTRAVADGVSPTRIVSAPTEPELRVMLHFTLDFEEWFDAENVKPYVDARDITHSSMYVMDQILEFLESRQIRGTFFCLGKTAQENRSLITKISDHGHEVASHGWSHTLLTKLSREQTFDELSKTKALLEDLTGTEIVGYRSPCFSYNEHVDDCLEETGHRYTSMRISASLHDRYRQQYASSGKLVDFALPVVRLGRFSFPASGGGWFRLFPTTIQRLLLRAADTDHAVFYCHPWDFDANQPRLAAPWTVRFRHTVNVRTSFGKLAKLDFDRRPLRELLNDSS